MSWISILRNTKPFEDFPMIDHVEIRKIFRMNKKNICNKSTAVYYLKCLTEIESFIYFLEEYFKKVYFIILFCAYDFRFHLFRLPFYRILHPFRFCWIMKKNIRKNFQVSVSFFILCVHSKCRLEYSFSLIIIYKQLYWFWTQTCER